ncbi:hypothetical protein C8Q69DRAFT_498105 [Paecilomyces variotii]|uniref:Glycoprotease family protein n=1 Tax=Byssochlamys spectabilis TaxID=264951 RepID=A0A443HX62_BYSSP|nr:hypothetical protein C8Q69DRAFT_498105 [Paecilomyces variotii]KAJ9361325.1 hypothetical protein DTO280E4_3799 [Paecilomyces variotii]RWQ96432.1 hypothetical protein C8Q69DRAFT_498105 [Paecilomyces variotii]
MASNVQINQSSLRPPAVPNFPLSSPITEEVSSLSCSSGDMDMEKSKTIESHVRRHIAASHNVAEDMGNQTDTALGMYLDPSSAEHVRRRPSTEKQYKSNRRQSIHGIVKKQKPTGLSLITDFSRTESSKRKEEPPAPFVDLNDLKLLSKTREKQRSAKKIKHILRRVPHAGYHELEGGSSEPQPLQHQLTSQNGTGQTNSVQGPHGLSPSDRPIVIGMQFPYDAERNKEDGVNILLSKEPESAQSQATPITPSIIVTPATEDPDWVTDTTGPRHPRPTSSIYSDHTLHASRREIDIPPVPAIPEQHRTEKLTKENSLVSSSDPTVSQSKQRPFSSGTVFEEDESPGPTSGGQSLARDTILHRLSINTDTNRHQSQGWWTYLLSPLLSRSSTMMTRKRTPDTERPSMPSASAASVTSTNSSEKWWEKTSFSPETPKTSTTRQSAVTTWSNIGERSLAEKDESNDPFTDFSQCFATDSFFDTGGRIAGSAAEYYQACASELLSRTPYFECVNHVCSVTPRDRAVVVDSPEITADSDHDHIVVNPNNPFTTGNTGSNRERSDSESTIIEEGSVASPSENSARVRSVESPVRGVRSETSPVASRRESFAGRSRPPAQPSEAPFESRSAESDHTDAANPPPYSHFETGRSFPRYRAVFPPARPAQPESPDPISPGFQETMVSRGSLPMADIEQPRQPLPAYNSDTRSVGLPPRPGLPVTIADMGHPSTAQNEAETRRRRLEKEDAIGRKVGGLWRGRGPFSKKGCFGRPGREGRVRRRWYIGLGAIFLLIVVLAIALATTLTRKGDDTPVQSQWLNLTGYPPMPTGISTIAGPEAHVENTGCVHPSTMWSCALPKEQHAMNSPYSADEPNFRVQIRFHNGTYGNSTTVASKSTRTAKRSIPGSNVAVRSVWKRLLRPRDLFAENLFDPSPAAPSIKDQIFLGNTTDNNTVPYAGEETPFFITILSPAKVSASRLTRRADDNAFPNLTSVIPGPDIASDGTAAAANLYPLPVSQPIRLYNRGLPSEHYGFYTYFDRSIFLKSTAPLNDSDTGEVPDDEDGGSTKSEAHVRCTWSQTRFLVQIWTQPDRSSMTLIGNSSTKASAASSRATDSGDAQNVTSSSADDFTRPGSFPYPVTITLDRHGGNTKEKMVYCYGMDDRERIIPTDKKLQLEFRGFGGTLINPAPGIFNITNDSDSDSLVGIDGGTGGCSCQWRNWIQTL